MLERYSHQRIEAKRKAVAALSVERKAIARTEKDDEQPIEMRQ